jgi:hypothetical protein
MRDGFSCISVIFVINILFRSAHVRFRARVHRRPVIFFGSGTFDLVFWLFYDALRFFWGIVLFFLGSRLLGFLFFRNFSPHGVSPKNKKNKAKKRPDNREEN